jgi:glyoxylase-like metal-dependent hydrolase (beta-lactamase superfamily II)
VFAAVFLTGSKLTIGLLTGSLGILSEALHSGLDLVAAIITFFSVRISDKPADEDHHYGHGKIENLSALIETGRPEFRDKTWVPHRPPRPDQSEGGVPLRILYTPGHDVGSIAILASPSSTSRSPSLLT